MLSERIPLRRVKPDYKKNPQWKKHAEQFPEGASLQTVPDFFSRLKSYYWPTEECQGCEYFRRMAPHSAPSYSSLARGSSGGARWDVGIGVPAGGRNTGKAGPHPEEKHSHSQLLVFVIGPGVYQVAGKHPFLCQRCVISLREIVSSEQKAMTTHFCSLAKDGEAW